MLRSISLGVYQSGNSFLHRLQARTKLLALAILIGWLVLANQRPWHFAPYVILVSLMIVCIVTVGMSPRELWRRTWLIVGLLVLGIPTTLSSRAGDSRALSALGPLVTTYGVLQHALLYGSIVCAALLIISLLPPIRRLRSYRVFRRLGIVSGVLLVIALLTFWFVRRVPAATVLPIGPYVITYGGVWSLITFVVVLPVLYTFSILLTMTTSPVALIEGLTLLLAPLRTFRLPVDDFALMALLALRFIPTLLGEVEQLIKAQAVRGADLAHGTLRERIESLVMLFVPLLRGTLRRASELAVALDARGYESEGKQTMLHETRLKRIDYITLAALLLLVAGSMLF